MVRVKRKMLNELSVRVVEFNAGDPARIQHTIKVHSFAKLIGETENIESDCMFCLEAAALLHDIGIHAAEEKYGSCAGKYQEELGPEYARALLEEVGFRAGIIERVCYLVGHHHTYTNIEGVDYRILLEADFLVNLYEENASKEAVQSALTNIFKTETGINLCAKMFHV